MTVFVPTGYLTLAQTLSHMTQKREPALYACVQAEEAEWELLKNRLHLTDAIRANYLNVHSPQQRSPSSGVHPFTERDKAHLETIERRRTLLTNARGQEKPVLWRALGDGILKSYGLTSWGAIVDIPVEPWRTVWGANAIYTGSIKWWTGSPLFQIEASVLLLRKEFEHWLAEIVPDPALSQPDEPSDSAAADLQYMEDPANGQGNPSIASRNVNARAAVPQEKATSWMYAAAMEARRKGTFLSRTEGIEQCQLALNCQRDVARSAYTALPEALKQPRGKPAQWRPPEGKASTE